MTRKIVAPAIICLFLFSLIISVFNSCKHDSMFEQLPLIKFDKQILPIFLNNCAYAGCHDGKTGDARLNLTDYNHIIRDVVAGKPYSSRVYTAIIDVYGRLMPPNMALQEKDRMLIKVWIEQGAKNIIDTTHIDTTHHALVCDTNNVTLKSKIDTILSTYCFSCHSNANAQTLGAAIKLQDSVDIAAKQSRLIGSLKHLPGFYSMPLGLQKMDTCKITLFSIWVRKLNVNTTIKCDTNHVTFAVTLSKVLTDNCSSCHSNTAAQSFGAGIKLQDSIDVVSRNARLMGSLEQLPGFFAMPKGGPKLDTCKISQFAIWYRKLNLNVPATCDTTNITFAGTLSNILTYNCSTCHSNANAQNLGAGIKLQDSADVVSRHNRLMGSLEHLPNYYAMPLGQPKLDTCKISKFAIWFRKLHIVDTTPPPPPPPVLAGYACFSRDILPIMQSSCSMAGTNCHNGTGEESFPLTNYQQVSLIVNPGNPTGSSLYNVITNRSEDFMPPSPYSPLPKSNIDSIYSWILHGATNTTCTVVCDTNKFNFTNDIYPLFQTYCLGCHSGSNAQKGVRLDSYTYISSVATSGQLYKSITGNGSPLMPPGGQLSTCNIRKIEKWTNAGAPKKK